MALLDLLGRRWTMRVCWELSIEPAGFRALQARCDGMSPSVLSERLVELAQAGVVEQNAVGDYQLSARGHSLTKLLAPLNKWANEWANPVAGDSAV
jgi:DNA-binding HxlR family transcriptional regulator